MSARRQSNQKASTQKAQKAQKKKFRVQALACKLKLRDRSLKAEL
jgi:hypothetical protein